jgi:hypothetical protein
MSQHGTMIAHSLLSDTVCTLQLTWRDTTSNPQRRANAMGQTPRRGTHRTRGT